MRKGYVAKIKGRRWAGEEDIPGGKNNVCPGPEIAMRLNYM